MTVIIHSCFSQLHFDIDQNETANDTESEDNDVNCKNDMKLIDGVENVEEPKQGMVFNSLDEIALHYRKYGKQQGFAVVQKNERKNTSGHTCYITLSCASQGTRKASSSKPIQTTRTGCKACLNARLVNTKWYATNVSAKHNHDLSPGKARYFRCNKNLDSTAKRKLLINDRAGISMSKSYNSLIVEAGGYEHLEFGEKDCRNFIAKSRHLRLGTGGAGALCDYFKRMQAINNNLYFAIDFDDDCRYEMSFAPFVGVNHHGQSILLGAALISSEDTKTFVWLFETWLNCMNERAPSAIITDQNRAMKNAIRKVFPNTRHRWCLWHILKKLLEKFGSHSQYHAIKGAIRSCVYESQTRDEFDANWQSLLDCYNLRDNAWLCGLYSERTFWVPAYLKDVFWAGMTTTQRSESMNAFFYGYVHSSTTLKELWINTIVLCVETILVLVLPEELF
ncbi:protein FAR1-RELATED SEQUENCE 5-like [Alnus glutinosa]|uniref:protein FAR1-RELATED SEQUENCE 5-like n=1 Tax=Alnus glutinosa TaxID=3517 RepID=UPI002D797048|nr:protein FAR1-RELATED SEQUENCE 5-like [Alnus glutinosa]